ncbi:MAG: hypothetical protein A2147_04740 [Chloroflexi bacterium RBG_16_57_8]|nr:MAG: hypothetical protein A2147_04740 [Chloroflexi bacterium RBG_16_57_8]
MRLKDKVAVVTGAGSGIGRAIAELFGREGAKVVVADITDESGRETARLIENEGGQALFVHADVSRSDEVKAMVTATVQTYGRLDIVVNNAAYMHDSRERSSVTGTTEEEWDLSMGVTLDGVFRVSKYALPEMIKGGGGAIVNVASIVAAVVVPNLAAYCTAKAGMVQLTKSLALDYGAANIRANAVCPGIIATPGSAPELEDPDRRRFLLSRTILDRPGLPEEVAYAALFLASEESSYVTGSVLMVDGGWSAR